MATKKTTSKTTPKKTVKRTRKSAAQKTAVTVDYYPNRMTVAVSALAGTLLVLLALIAVLGWK